MREAAAVQRCIAISAIVLSIALGSCSQNIVITSPRMAFVYGVSNYRHGTLKYTVEDARDMRTALTSSGWMVTEREDSYVTKAQIRSDISSMSAESSDTTLLVYFSGHGVIAEQYGLPSPYTGAYMLPYDAVTENDVDPSNLIAPSEMSAWISQAGKKKVIVILDNCYSGAFLSSGSTIDAAPQSYGPYEGGTTPDLFGVALANFGTLLSRNATSSGSQSPIVISAAGSLEPSWDGTTEMNNGAFTYYLLESASKGDANGDGLVTATEAYYYATSSIQDIWNVNYGDIYDWVSDAYEDFHPHLSGGTRDLVLFVQ